MIINKVILHVLDKNSDIPIINDVQDEINAEIDSFYQKIIRKILRDQDLRKAKFTDYETNQIRVCVDHILYDENSFILSSKGIATAMFDSVKVNSDLDSCDLAVVNFIHKEQNAVAIIKLDYKKLYTHEIGFDENENKVSVKMVSSDIALQDNQKIIHAAIIYPSGVNDYWHLEVLDKVSEKEGEDSSFVRDFLKVEKVKDEKYLTKMFKNTTDNWITNAFASDVKKAEDLRSFLNYTLSDSNDISIEKFISEANLDENKEKSYKELMEEKDINEDFVIDKSWIEKKLKRRAIKTSSGFSLRGLSEDFNDPMKFSLVTNEDNTVDIVIKNVEFFEEV